MSQLLTKIVGSALLLTALPFAVGTPIAQAEVVGYSCGTSNGVPATMVRTSKGNEVAVIQFVSQHFSDSGWSPERRCQEVSQRFENLNRKGLLRQAFLTTGRKNGQNIVCVAPEQGGSCMNNGILFTLRPGRDPGETLRKLVNVARTQSGPLSETTSRPYFGLDEILSTAESSMKPQVTEPTSEAAPATPGTSSGESFMP